MSNAQLFLFAVDCGTYIVPDLYQVRHIEVRHFDIISQHTVSTPPFLYCIVVWCGVYIIDVEGRHSDTMSNAFFLCWKMMRGDRYQVYLVWYTRYWKFDIPVYRSSIFRYTEVRYSDTPKFDISIFRYIEVHYFDTPKFDIPIH